jgi:hypothetical protein
MLRKLGIIAVLSLIVTAIAVVPALAVGPTSTTRDGGLHFVGAPDVTATKTATSAFLTATGEVAGAGPTATATLSSTAEFTAGCLNRGGNEPRGLQEVTSTVLGSTTFQTRSGRGTFTVQSSDVTIPESFSCPPGQAEEVIVGPITFTDITLTITSQTGTITATFPDIDP